MEATVGSQGRITVPPEIRHKLGLKPGDKLRFAFDQDGRLIASVPPEKNTRMKVSPAAPASPTA